VDRDREAAAHMKILAILLILAAVAVSLLADYKWRRWMAARRRNRQ
jgi:hypothetical protein